MEQPNQFRSSFNGFNREDVVRYMEFINNKHASQVAQLTNELEYLRGKQDTLDAGRVSQLEKDLSAAQAENDALKQRIAELEKQLAGRPEAPAPNQSELEAYRRAERVERTAKERARRAERALERVGLADKKKNLPVPLQREIGRLFWQNKERSDRAGLVFQPALFLLA